MSKRTFRHVLVGLGAVVIATLALGAAGQDEGSVISFKGTVNWAWATSPSADVRAIDPNAEGQIVIFSNLGTKNHLYEDTVAWDVAGPRSGVQQQWVAMPFTPTFDAEAQQIAVAIEHNSGSPNSFVLSLNADSGEIVPGKVLHRWSVKNAPKFGTCCILDVVKSAQPLKLKKGTQYWVVAETNDDTESTRMEWDLSPLSIEGNFVFNNGQGWYEYTAFTSAFAVYGRRVGQ